jgi:hypothetical protein
MSNAGRRDGRSRGVGGDRVRTVGHVQCSGVLHNVCDRPNRHPDISVQNRSAFFEESIEGFLSLSDCPGSC